MPRPPARGLSILLAALAVSCGGGGTTRADYIARADALCVGVRHQLDAIPAPTTLAEMATYLSRSLQLSEDLQRKLRAMAPPNGDQPAVARVLDSFDGVLAKGRIAQARAASGDQSAADLAVRDLELTVQTAGRLAGDYGFRACGTAAGRASSSP